MASDLPTIEYVGADGVRRELDFQRAPHAPWQALLVESEETEGEMRHVGTEQLRELRVDGEPRSAVTLVDAFDAGNPNPDDGRPHGARLRRRRRRRGRDRGARRNHRRRGRPLYDVLDAEHLTNIHGVAVAAAVDAQYGTSYCSRIDAAKLEEA